MTYSVGFGSVSAWLHDEDCSPDGVAVMGFLNCTKIMVMLSHPSPPAVDGAKHLSSTRSHTAESLLSCIIFIVWYQLEARPFGKLLVTHYFGMRGGKEMPLFFKMSGG